MLKFHYICQILVGEESERESLVVLTSEATGTFGLTSLLQKFVLYKGIVTVSIKKNLCIEEVQ